MGETLPGGKPQLMGEVLPAGSLHGGGKPPVRSPLLSPGRRLTKDGCTTLPGPCPQEQVEIFVRLPDLAWAVSPGASGCRTLPGPCPQEQKAARPCLGRVPRSKWRSQAESPGVTPWAENGRHFKLLLDTPVNHTSTN